MDLYINIRNCLKSNIRSFHYFLFKWILNSSIEKFTILMKTFYIQTERLKYLNKTLEQSYWNKSTNIFDVQVSLLLCFKGLSALA